MEIPTSLMFILWLAVLLVLVWIALRMRPASTDQVTNYLESAVAVLKADLITKQTESLLGLRESIDAANRLINERLAEGTTSLDRRMAVLGEIETHLGKLTVQADNIEAVGRNIQSLSDLLRPPQLRGAVGEMLLENILAQILPAAAFEKQYRFADGLRVDAIVRLGERLLPIDAKFPLEVYERLQKEPDNVALERQFSQTLRKHIDNIAEKYIRPGEKTLDFAVMYIPAEAVYFQLVTHSPQDTFEYALAKRVIPSSPGQLYAFLATVAALHSEVAVAGMELSESSRQIRSGIDQLAETTTRLARFHERMESSLRGLTAGFDKARVELDQLRLQVEKLRQPFGRGGEKVLQEQNEQQPDSSGADHGRE